MFDQASMETGNMNRQTDSIYSSLTFFNHADVTATSNGSFFTVIDGDDVESTAAVIS